LLVAKLLFFSEPFPLVLDLDRLVLPLLADDLGDIGVRKAWILRDDLSLMMLAV